MPKDKSDIIRLRHMYDAVQKAIQFTIGKERNDLTVNEQLALALVRLIEILAEASSKVTSETQRRHPMIPWKQITSGRQIYQVLTTKSFHPNDGNPFVSPAKVRIGVLSALTPHFLCCGIEKIIIFARDCCSY